MPSLAKIVLPVDFSERSTGAARYARALAAHFHSELILVHVLSPIYPDLIGMDISGSILVDLDRTRNEQAQGQLNDFVAAELAGVNVRCVVLRGEPASQVVRLAHDEEAGLIAMPTHGYGLFRQFILGSNTAKVLHDADCPVWTGVHMEAPRSPGETPFRRILCAIDLGSQSARTLEWAAWLGREFKSALTLIHATNTPAQALKEPDLISSADTSEIAEEEILMFQRDSGTDADVLLEDGEPAKVICSAAARVKADLLVIGRGSATGVFGRLRTNSYAIIRQSPCPVVSV